MREDTQDYRSLFLKDTPLMDVRAPVEFSKGAFPNAINLPLMIDSERQAVGLRYKQRGQASAIELGHQLVSGSLRDARIQAWIAFAQAHPEGYLYCFLGGLRSSI
jgi:tRNA 2-selenouridine synthase